MLSLFENTRKEYYSNVIGKDTEIPDEIKDMIDNVIIAYYRNTGSVRKVKIQPTLKLIATNYLTQGPEKTFNLIRRLHPNKELRKDYKRKGIDIDAYETGITKTYHLKTDANSLKRKIERVNHEIDMAALRMSEAGISLEEIYFDGFDQLNTEEKLKALEKVVNEHEFKKQPLKQEIRGHIQTARSITGETYEMERDAEFYVCKDPLHTLHMGEFFNTCLSLAKAFDGVNAWASVIQTMDSNKNVIYARGTNGQYYGRNRTVLTDKGILCTRFYSNGEMNMDNAWIDYLSSYADHTKQDVIIPKICADYLIHVTQFVDELLDKIYLLPKYYNIKQRKNLIGQLIVGFAPHTSAGIIGRVIGFTDANVCYAHPLWHNIKRRDCWSRWIFDPPTD